jgi:hypothetical protein
MAYVQQVDNGTPISGQTRLTEAGSRCRNRIVQAWQQISPKLELFTPKNHEEVVVTLLWYSSYFVGFNFGVLPQRAAKLNRKGISTIKALWNTTTLCFKTWEEISIEFIIPILHCQGLTRFITAVPRTWLNWLIV